MRAILPAAVKARIHVEDFRGPLLVVGGQDDQIWASGMMAQNIAERRAAAGLETVALIFPDAGHALSGTGWMPTTQYNADHDQLVVRPGSERACTGARVPGDDCVAEVLR